MAYDEHLAERISQSLTKKSIPFEEKRMFGGMCFMVDEKMCIGVVKDTLMARVGPDKYNDLLKIKGAQPMDFTGRPMKGFIFITPQGVDMDDDLDMWVDHCLEYNPEAKSSKKK